jgi:hypothetical protein
VWEIPLVNESDEPPPEVRSRVVATKQTEGGVPNPGVASQKSAEARSKVLKLQDASWKAFCGPSWDVDTLSGDAGSGCQCPLGGCEL